MKRLGQIVAVLAFVVALLVGAAGGAMVQAGAMDHHGSHPPADSAPSHGGSHDSGSHNGTSHKATLVVLAPCCPAAEAPAKHAVAVVVTAVKVPWHPRPDGIPGARDIRPEPHPPKTLL